MNDPAKQTETKWCRFEYLSNGETSVIGCQYPDDNHGDRAAYPYHVFIGYGYDKEGSARLPNAEEWKKLDAIERTMSDVLRTQELGHLTFTVASDGYYQWNIYSKVGDETVSAILGEIKKLPASPKADLFEYESTSDPEWSAYQPIRDVVDKAAGNAAT